MTKKTRAEQAARDTRRAATRVEKADIAIGHAAARYQDHPAVKALGAVSEIADQPPLIALSVATLAVGLVRDDARLAQTGARMLASHLVATAIKTLIKQRVDRARPGAFTTHHQHRITPGDTDDGPMNSFPSGHTAGAVAVTRAIAREYPATNTSAALGAAAIAAIQPVRGTHFPIDIAAGAIVGLASEWLVARAFEKAAIDGKR
ncbi:phosphatase PAP2 family protein [Sphingomonas aestuarii]